MNEEEEKEFEKCIETTRKMYIRLLEKKKELTNQLDLSKIPKNEKVETVEDLLSLREKQDRDITTFHDKEANNKIVNVYLEENKQKIFHLLNPTEYRTRTEKERYDEWRRKQPEPFGG